MRMVDYYFYQIMGLISANTKDEPKKPESQLLEVPQSDKRERRMSGS